MYGLKNNLVLVPKIQQKNLFIKIITMIKLTNQEESHVHM